MKIQTNFTWKIVIPYLLLGVLLGLQFYHCKQKIESLIDLLISNVNAINHFYF
jgi:hypothetical protein